MIKIHVWQGPGKMRITIDGHANAAPHGEDIVCAAVSAIAQTAALGLESVAEAHPDFVHFTRGAYLLEEVKNERNQERR